MGSISDRIPGKRFKALSIEEVAQMDGELDRSHWVSIWRFYSGADVGQHVLVGLTDLEVKRMAIISAYARTVVQERLPMKEWVSLTERIGMNRRRAYKARDFFHTNHDYERDKK